MHKKISEVQHLTIFEIQCLLPLFSLIHNFGNLNKTLAEMFEKFPSILRVIDMSDRNPPITAR